MSQGWLLCTVLLARSIDVIHEFQSRNQTLHPHSAERFHSDVDHLISSSITSVGLYFLGCFAAIYFFKLFSYRQIDRLKIRFFGQVLRQNVAWHEEHNGETISMRIVEEFQTMQNGIDDNLAILLYRIISAIFNIAISLWFGWKITLIILCAVVCALIPVLFLLPLQSLFAQHFQDTTQKGYSIVEQTIRSIKTVFAYGGQQTEVELYEKTLENGSILCRSRDICTGLQGSFNWLFVCVATAVGIHFGVAMLEEYSLSILIIIICCLTNLCLSLVNGVQQFEALQASRVAAAKIYRTINLATNIDSLSRDGWQLRDYRCDIVFKNVYHKHPNSCDLKDINLTIYAGETVALVGPKGCGKTTLVGLIQRLYDATRGDIIFDETNIKTLNVAWLRSQIGLLTQDSILFDLTIEQNIRLGLNDYEMNSVSFDRVVQASKEANAHEFIIRLPDGYNTIVGQRTLSGGQRQRIAVARTLISNPKILILDEASSALDIKNEQIVQSALDQASHERTTIIIPHRLSNIRKVNRIIVMDNGQIIQTGSHDELLASCALYSKLIKAQELYIPSNAAQYSRHLKSQRSLSVISTLEDSLKLERSSGSPEPFKHFWAILHPHRFPLIIAIICSLCFGLCPPLIAMLLGNFIDNINDDFSLKSMQNVASTTFSCYLLLALVGFVLNLAQVVLFGWIVERVLVTIRVQIFKTILSQKMSWFENENICSMVCSFLSTNISEIHALSSQRISTIIECLPTLVITVILSFMSSFSLTIVMFLAVLFIGLFGLLESFTDDNFISNNYKYSQRTMKIVFECLNAVKTIVSLHKEQYFLRRFSLSVEKHRAGIKYNIVLKSFIISCTLSFQLSLHILAFIITKHTLLNGQTINAGQFVAIVQSMIVSAIILSNVTALLSDLLRSKVAILSLFGLIENTDDDIWKTAHFECHNTTNNSALNCVKIDKTSRSDGCVTFNKVHFAYPKNREFPILRGLSFKVNKGQIVALVGSSGAGKSTTIHLLQHFYVPSKGSIVSF